MPNVWFSMRHVDKLDVLAACFQHTLLLISISYVCCLNGNIFICPTLPLLPGKILLPYKVINRGPNVSRNCKHGSLVDSDGLERGGGRVVTLLGKGNTHREGNSTMSVLGIQSVAGGKCRWMPVLAYPNSEKDCVGGV